MLDAGCGTGMLTVAMSEHGHDVVGVDPASAMLDVAKRRKGGDAVEWHCSTLQEFRSENRFDLIYMTGHAFQCLLDDRDIFDAFQSVARLLMPDGQFVFETRNFDAHPWLRWSPDRSRRTGVTSSGRSYEMFHRVLDVDGRFVTFETSYQIGHEGPVMSRSTLRFCELDEIVQFAQQAGLHIEQHWGDWDRSSLSEASPEVIVSLKLQ